MGPRYPTTSVSLPLVGCWVFSLCSLSGARLFLSVAFTRQGSFCGMRQTLGRAVACRTVAQTAPPLGFSPAPAGHSGFCPVPVSGEGGKGGFPRSWAEELRYRPGSSNPAHSSSQLVLGQSPAPASAAGSSAALCGELEWHWLSPVGGARCAALELLTLAVGSAAAHTEGLSTSKPRQQQGVERIVTV